MRWLVRYQVWPGTSTLLPAGIHGSAKTADTRPDARDQRARWLERFHAGERAVLDEVYRAHVDSLSRAVAAVLGGADRETVVHEVFFKMMSNGDFRRAFQGGDLGAWLVVVTRHHAIDYARRRQREAPMGLDVGDAVVSPQALASQTEARVLIERFSREVLPEKWRAVFEARFVRGLSQTEAAVELRKSRTTLVYQELRIRRLLRAFLLEDAP